jgi:carboxyl-terminal processing protease
MDEKKQTNTARYWLQLFGVLVVGAILLGTGWLAGASGVLVDRVPALAAVTISSEQPAGADFSPVWKAWHIIDQKFVDAYATTTATSTEGTTEDDKKQERVWGMIKGLAASLDDPYTVFLPPRESEIFHDDISGSFEGVGMEIAIRDSILTVVSPLKGTPAFRAGVKSGDMIRKIDDTRTDDMGIDDAVGLIRGPRGTTVILTILREGESEPLEISIVRDVIEIPTIDTIKRDDGIYIVELSNFSARSPDLFRQALREFVATDYQKLIIDLRGNPGGYLDAAVDMASWFLPKGKIVVTEDFGGKSKNREHRSRGYDIFNENLELVFLIDRGSASASEILAGSLKEHGVATLVGTRSFGKGSVQELVDITSDTSLKITVARWLLAGDVFITKDGIEPNILVDIEKLEEEAKEAGQTDQEIAERDYILEAAIEFLHN